MSDYDDALRLRLADEDDADERSRTPPLRPGGAPATIARTATLGSYPTTAGGFYACTTGLMGGTEAEGSTGGPSFGGETVLAYNLGSSIPPVNTTILITFVANRWVFRYDA